MIRNLFLLEIGWCCPSPAWVGIMIWVAMRFCRRCRKGGDADIPPPRRPPLGPPGYCHHYHQHNHHQQNHRQHHHHCQSYQKIFISNSILFQAILVNHHFLLQAFPLLPHHWKTTKTSSKPSPPQGHHGHPTIVTMIMIRNGMTFCMGSLASSPSNAQCVHSRIRFSCIQNCPVYATGE